MNRIVSAASTGIVGAALLLGTAEAGRQKTEWFDCGPLGNWGWECTSPIPTPTSVPTATPTVAPTPAPAPVVAPAQEVEAAPVATVAPPPVKLLPPAVFVATPIPVLVPAGPNQEPVQFVPLPPKAGSGGYLDAHSPLATWLLSGIALVCAGVAGYFVTRKDK